MKKQFISVLLPLISLLFFTAAKAETVPAGDFLLPDGTLNVAAIGSKQLTLNLAGWHIALDPERGPVFSTEPQMLADSWSALGSGLNSTVNVMTVSGTDIYVGGNFTGVGAGGTAVPGLNYIAKWNGSAWSALGSGFDGDVYALAVIGTDLYVGGAFRWTADGTMGLFSIAKWNGATWTTVGGGFPSGGGVAAFAVSGSNLYVGGRFTDAGAGVTPVPGLNYIAKWGTGGAAPSVYSIGDVHPDGGIVYQVSSGGTHGKMSN